MSGNNTFFFETKVFTKCNNDNKTLVCIKVLRTFSQHLSFLLIFFILLVNQVEGLVEGFEGTLEHVCVHIEWQDPMELI